MKGFPLHLIRPGDWLVTLGGVLLCAALLPLLWRGGAPEKAVIRLDGQVVAELPLTVARRFDVLGPLGMTTIEVQPGRARVATDPGPHQYCVKQGWLVRGHAVAICAPNHISLTLTGRGAGYDSISY